MPEGAPADSIIGVPSILQWRGSRGGN